MMSKKLIGIRDMAIFAMLGALMYVSKVLLEFLPNVHLVGTFIVAETAVYRKRALFPIYTFVLLTGFFSGFAVWWLPYLYIWLPLWAGVMLLSKRLPPKKYAVLYMLLSAAHGLLYGTLYAPVQALLFGLDFKSTIAWIIAGLPWDAVQGVGNFVAGILIVPLISIMEICERTSKKE